MLLLSAAICIQDQRDWDYWASVMWITRVRLRKQTTVSFDHHMTKTVVKFSGKRIMFGHHNSHASSESSMGLAEK